MLDLILDLLTCLPGGGPGVFSSFRHWCMDRKTRNWPVTPITIVRKALKSPSTVTLSYRYSVGKEAYGGYQELRYYGDPALLFARHDPKRPERSWIP
jgi:hypothetical protein